MRSLKSSISLSRRFPVTLQECEVIAMDKTLEALKKANKTLDRINGKMDKLLMMMGRLIIIALAVKLVIKIWS